MKEKNITLNKVKPKLEISNICQKPRIQIDYIMSLKNSNLSKTHMEQSVEPNFLKKFKVIASLPILCPYFRFYLKRKISQKIQQTWTWESISNYFICSSWTFKVELQLCWYRNFFSSSFKKLLINNSHHPYWILSVKQNSPSPSRIPNRQYEDG